MIRFGFTLIGFFLASSSLVFHSSAHLNAAPAPGQGNASPNSRLVALRVVGSSVKNAQGEFLGRIEEAAVNPNSGQIVFAMLQLYYPTNHNRITPVPWKVLSYTWDQSKAGGLPGAVQVFNLNMSRAQLERAPTLDRNQWPDLNEAYWSQRIFAYFGVTPDMGPNVTASAGQGAAISSQPSWPPAPPYELGPSVIGSAAIVSSVIVDTNLPGPITNAPPLTIIPPGATNPIFNTNIFVNNTNFFLNNTNFFVNNTNFFPGTKTPFNPDVPSTFPPAIANTNLNPFFITNFPPSTVLVSNSPFNPPFGGPADTLPLPAPAPKNSPWSPEFAGPDIPAPPSTSPSQSSPWSPAFNGSSGPPLAGGPRSSPWSPALLNPNAISGETPPVSSSPWVSGPAISPQPMPARPWSPPALRPAPAPARRR